MKTQIEQYILSQSSDRQKILADIHAIIIDEDKTAIPVIEPMMGKEMIVYKDRGMMKYGLAGVKNHMSLHVLPIYGSKVLYEKYKLLLPNANFQKGCINFSNIDEMPLKIVRQLMADCAKVDLVKIRADYLKEKSLKTKSNKKA